MALSRHNDDVLIQYGVSVSDAPRSMDSVFCGFGICCLCKAELRVCVHTGLSIEVFGNVITVGYTVW
jgi:hypothetical protein